MTAVAPGDQFLAWGWRIPFLLSVVLILVGYLMATLIKDIQFDDVEEGLPAERLRRLARSAP